MAQPRSDNSVRAATVADLAALLELERAGFPVLEQWSEQSWRSELTEPALQVLIIGTDPLLGAIALRIAGDDVELDRIVVHPRARRSGIARTLINNALDGHRAAEKMILEVWTGNAAAIALYRSFGFTELINRRDYYGPGRDAVIMSLPIQDHRRVQDHRAGEVRA
ncbi:GNAT family N-acetyltransferase [Microlunatus elymi]|nr:GNAT family N-acetyltransferase [Microlunatus elymi]